VPHTAPPPGRMDLERVRSRGRCDRSRGDLDVASAYGLRVVRECTTSRASTVNSQAPLGDERERWSDREFWRRSETPTRMPRSGSSSVAAMPEMQAAIPLRNGQAERSFIGALSSATLVRSMGRYSMGNASRVGHVNSSFSSLPRVIVARRLRSAVPLRGLRLGGITRDTHVDVKPLWCGRRAVSATKR
jgi:hypothetical protein